MEQQKLWIRWRRIRPLYLGNHMSVFTDTTSRPLLGPRYLGLLMSVCTNITPWSPLRSRYVVFYCNLAHIWA